MSRLSYFSDPVQTRIVNDKTPLPSQAATPEDDEDLLADHVWCDRPVKMDYGYNVKYVFLGIQVSGESLP